MPIGLGHYFALFSSKTTNELLAWYKCNANNDEAIKISELAEHKLIQKLNQWSLPCDYVQNVQVRSDTLHQLQEDGSITKQVRNSCVTCQVIRTGSSSEFDGVLIFHCHGGSFCSFRPAAHQSCLRQLAQAMPGATIFSPDYSLAPEFKYPQGLQDIVDVYLAIVGRVTSNVTHVLGFQPRSVIIYGDSAGGNFSLSLCHVLREIDVPIPDKVS